MPKNVATVNNSEMLLVTIGIPTYNRARGYLREVLDCVVAQTYANIEIVVADNGSTDNTAELVKSYGDSRIRYYRNDPPLKPNDNFNFCLKQATGVYFQLLHDDDLIDPDFVECCMKAASNRQDIGLIRTGARIIDAGGGVLSELQNKSGGLTTGEFFLSWLRSQTWMFLSSILFNTAYLRQNGGFQSKHQLFQDVLAEFVLAAKYGRIDVPDVKASFRKHGAQSTGAARLKQWCEDSELLLQTMAALAPAQKETIVREGRVHFSKHNYELASTDPALISRYMSYMSVYRMFSYACSPWRYFADNAYRNLFTWLGQHKRALLTRIASR